VSLSDEVLQHLLGNFEIRDDAIFHWADRHDIARRAAEHFFCVASDRLYLIRYLIDRNDRGFRNNDAASLRIHECVRCSEIDSKVARK
jgi:hypothetical protein